MSDWTTHPDEYADLLAALRSVGLAEGFVFNPDAERVEKVVGLMTENLVTTGSRYCPCKQTHPIDREHDRICHCAEWKDEIARDGHCFCRLFFRGE